MVIGSFAARILWRARRRLLAIGATELATFSLAFWVGINQALYGGPTLCHTARRAAPRAPRRLPSTSNASRARRRCSWTPSLGLLRWAPVLVLAFVGLFFLFRSVRGGLGARAAGSPGDRAHGGPVLRR